MLIDGDRLCRDTEKVLNQLESEGFDVLTITPVTSGNYGWTHYNTAVGSGSSATCASWGFGATAGVYGGVAL